MPNKALVLVAAAGAGASRRRRTSTATSRSSRASPHHGPPPWCGAGTPIRSASGAHGARCLRSLAVRHPPRPPRPAPAWSPGGIGRAFSTDCAGFGLKPPDECRNGNAYVFGGRVAMSEESKRIVELREGKADRQLWGPICPSGSGATMKIANPLSEDRTTARGTSGPAPRCNALSVPCLLYTSDAADEL